MAYGLKVCSCHLLSVGFMFHWYIARFTQPLKSADTQGESKQNKTKQKQKQQQQQNKQTNKTKQNKKQNKNVQ